MLEIRPSHSSHKMTVFLDFHVPGFFKLGVWTFIISTKR